MTGIVGSRVAAMIAAAGVLLGIVGKAYASTPTFAERQSVRANCGHGCALLQFTNIGDGRGGSLSAALILGSSGTLADHWIYLWHNGTLGLRYQASNVYLDLWGLVFAGAGIFVAEALHCSSPTTTASACGNQQAPAFLGFRWTGSRFSVVQSADTGL